MPGTVGPVTPISAPLTVTGGGAFVGPHVFEEAQRLAQERGDYAVARGSYAEHVRDAEDHNFKRLKRSQETLWIPPVISTQSRDVYEGTTPDESKLAHFDIYNARESSRPTWDKKDIVRRLGEPPVGNDDAVDGAYESIVRSLWFFLDGLGIDSIDAKHMAIKAAVHVGKAYNNAYYTNGTINLGDGDGKIFTKFAEDLTVIAHELGHGIVEMVLGGLTYWSQSGALNESMADVLGISALQFALGEETTKEATWLIGQKAMVPYKDKDGKMVYPALRSFSAPGTAYVNHPEIGTDPQPDNMDNYYSGSRDNYGVHINSGIPNRAFYLASTAIGGWSKDTVLKVWIEATKLISKNATFKQFADATLEVSKKLFPDSDDIYNAVSDAWKTVKVLDSDVISKEPEAYRITKPEIMEVFGIDAGEVGRLSVTIDNSELLAKAGVKKASVGFELDQDSKAKLVVLVYVDPDGPELTLPETLEDYKIVRMDPATLS